MASGGVTRFLESSFIVDLVNDLDIDDSILEVGLITSLSPFTELSAPSYSRQPLIMPFMFAPYGNTTTINFPKATTAWNSIKGVAVWKETGGVATPIWKWHFDAPISVAVGDRLVIKDHSLQFNMTLAGTGSYSASGGVSSDILIYGLNNSLQDRWLFLYNELPPCGSGYGIEVPSSCLGYERKPVSFVWNAATNTFYASAAASDSFEWYAHPGGGSWGTIKGVGIDIYSSRNTLQQVIAYTPCDDLLIDNIYTIGFPATSLALTVFSEDF